jgi:hypothetical protein
MGAPPRPIEVLRLTEYQANIAGGPAVTALLGVRVALVIDDGAGVDVGPAALPHLAMVVVNLERMLSVFDACVGRAPPVRNGLLGRVKYEVAFLSGAAGLARHGEAGVATGPAFLKAMVATAASTGRHVLHHAFGYETMRNYVFPEAFTAVFDYRLAAEGPDCWGWVNQGFVNVTWCLLSAQLPDVAFDYYGQDRAAFMDGMQAQAERYCRDARLAWADVFMHERLPWDRGSSLDNVYSGLLVLLYRRFGGDAFLRRWFRAIPLLLQRCPASKEDFVTARDNFYLAASFAAGVDLAPYFDAELRWPVSAAARDGMAAALIAADV